MSNWTPTHKVEKKIMKVKEKMKKRGEERDRERVSKYVNDRYIQITFLKR